MKTTIIITTFNRPAETKRCFDTIRKAEIIPGTHFIIVDDKSTDVETLRLIKEFNIPGCDKTVSYAERNSGISSSLKRGYTIAFDLLQCDIAMNLDNDCLVNNHFQIELLKLKAIWQNNIVTGFNCQTKNADGGDRHVITGGGAGYNFKKSVGGINMVLHKNQYENYMLPALDYVISHNIGNWDHLTCMHSGQDGKKIVCLQPSVIQHQATISSMGHLEQPDIATDFKGLTLPTVTLVCIDDTVTKGAINAIKCSTKNINFGAVKILSCADNLMPEDVKIPLLGSKEAYSRFIMNDLFNYTNTSHALIVQHDGYVMNWEAWQPEWLQYDYIGAPWPTEYNEHRVGNGGFSLRSQKLIRVTAGLNWGTTHPEDAVICRELRPMLESEYGIKFAPLEVAEKFSYEGYNQPDARYNGQFGFHNNLMAASIKSGTFTGEFPPKIIQQPAQKQQGLIFNQFLGLGDILFLVPMARHFMELGHDIVWPVADEYHADLKRHFPDIQFVLKSSWKMDYERRGVYNLRWQYGLYKVLPLRWNTCRLQDASDCMTTKYTEVGLDWKMWRGLKWTRNLNKEFRLAVELGCTNEDECNDFREYELHCNDFGNITDGGKESRSVGESGLPVVTMKQMQGFSLLDWALIIENATIIHAVSSSTIYIFETLNLKAKEIHLYGRNNGMKDHVYVQPIRTKNYILHP